MKKVLLLVVLSIMAFVTVACSSEDASGNNESSWPERPVTLSVFSSAGGGTDLGNRAIASAIEKNIDEKIKVVNQPGGSGGVAANFVMSQEHDGHTLLGMTEGIFPSAVLGAHPSTSKDWEYFLMGGTPAVISVPKDSKFQDMQQLLDYMKENPGDINWAASAVGAIWYVKSTLLSDAAGIEYNFVPYQGSNPSILASLNGEVDVVLTGVGEQSEFLEAKELRPLAMVELESHDVPGYEDVPSILDYVPSMEEHLPVDQIVGFAVPSNVPDETLTAIEEQFQKAMKSDIVKEYAANNYINVVGLSGEEAKEYVRKMESVFSWLLYDHGVTDKSPKEFGIEQPE
ncbi:tripartite tricarboxylate transporter substrate binding protein [Virgibacillus sp. JSM 102003]|uniref:tripartite tricarboxylate transporter substrate binding protein n=1 Tax=Virgibacillus sp. JSM 102003 TaxID=1562108 RepID=UPI0035C0AE3E